MDLLCPLGKGSARWSWPGQGGQDDGVPVHLRRGRAQPSEIALYILLVDERPEEVTEMEMCGFGEVIASSFDFAPERTPSSRS